MEWEHLQTALRHVLSSSYVSEGKVIASPCSEDRIAVWTPHMLK